MYKSDINSNVASNATWYPNSTNHLFSFAESGWFFSLVEAPAPSPGEQYLFWYAALRTTATRSKITDDGKKRSPPNRAAISHLLQTEQSANLCNFHPGYQRVLHRIPAPMSFAFPLPDAIHRKHSRYLHGNNLVNS